MDKLTLDPSTIPLPTGYPEATLGDVREAMRLVLALGEAKTCQCCGRTAKVYARSLGATMVRAMKVIAASRTGLENRDIIGATRQGGGGNTSLLAYWGLVTQDDKKRWRITDKGHDFLDGRIAIPSRVLIYNDTFLEFDIGKHVHVDDIGGRFDLDEVLSSASVAEAVVGAS